MDKKLTILASLCVILAVTAAVGFTTRAVFLFPTNYQVIEQNTYLVGKGENTNMPFEVHSTIYQYRWIDGQRYLIYCYSHPGSLTNIGKNFTAMKVCGASGLPYRTEALYNVTYISLGHSVGLTDASTVLPGEWNRTAGTYEYISLGHWNYTASFFPSGSGSTNATGFCWKSGIATAASTWAYDTFATIAYTSADQIDVEFGVTVTDT